MDKTIIKMAGQSHYRGSFTVTIDEECEDLIVPGRTGKFVPATYRDGGVWKELAKGRILTVDRSAGTAEGEVYTGASAKKAELEIAFAILSTEDCWEVDQYGASAKVLSGLVEYSLVQNLKAAGYSVRRMPEDTAKHIGACAYCDFHAEKRGVVKKIEVKSLWGTNTRFARLIHSKGKGYPTSSCKFSTQEFFAVSLFLRTGNIRDFAFARSVAKDFKSYGLPRAGKYPDHVNQNPLCEVGGGTWFETLDEVWNLE